MTDNRNREIYITESQYKIIRRHFDFCYYFMPENKGLDIVMELETALRQAAVVTKENIPADIISINTRFTIAEIKSGAEIDFTLGLPMPTDCNENNLSIFSPLGSAVIGCRVGDIIECEDSWGAKKYIVKSITNCMTETAA